MFSFLEPLRYLTKDNVLWVTLLRLGIAMLCGGVIGIERGRKRRPAGFRTHMLVCIGAALAMLISQYLSMMEKTFWSELVSFTASTDVSRLGAQVINGIGFLGAGTILVTGRQEVKGLTTAAGLWASACMGLAIGAGFVEGALLGCLFITATIVLLSRLEHVIMMRARNINLFVQFESMDDIGTIVAVLRRREIRIFSVEIHKAKESQDSTGALFALRLPQRMSHTALIAELAGVENVRSIEEL